MNRVMSERVTDTRERELAKLRALQESGQPVSISWSGGKDSTASILLAHERGAVTEHLIHVLSRRKIRRFDS